MSRLLAGWSEDGPGHEWADGRHSAHARVLNSGLSPVICAGNRPFSRIFSVGWQRVAGRCAASLTATAPPEQMAASTPPPRTLAHHHRQQNHSRSQPAPCQTEPSCACYCACAACALCAMCHCASCILCPGEPGVALALGLSSFGVLGAVSLGPLSHGIPSSDQGRLH